jgi:hypothetical protein
MKPGDLVRRPSTDTIHLVVAVTEPWAKEPKVWLVPSTDPPPNSTRNRRPRMGRWYRASLFEIVGHDPDLLVAWEVMES